MLAVLMVVVRVAPKGIAPVQQVRQIPEAAEAEAELMVVVALVVQVSSSSATSDKEADTWQKVWY